MKNQCLLQTVATTTHTFLPAKPSKSQEKPSSLFQWAQANPAHQPAPSALADSVTPSTSAHLSSCETNAPKLNVIKMQKVTWSIQKALNSAMTGRDLKNAPTPHNPICTNVPGAEQWITELKNVLKVRASNALTPYRLNAWLQLLNSLNLIHKYVHISNGLHFGFMGNVPTIFCTYIPPNNSSLYTHYDAFAIILDREYTTGHYIGPMSKTETEKLIGPFQTAPLSMVPKLGKPGKFHLMQNLSFPLCESATISSINSSINSNL